jgi:hypothetical protein
MWMHGLLFLLCESMPYVNGKIWLEEALKRQIAAI